MEIAEDHMMYFHPRIFTPLRLSRLHDIAQYLDRAAGERLHAPGKVVQFRIAKLVRVTFAQQEIRENAGGRPQLFVAMAAHDGKIARFEQLREVVFADRFNINTVTKLLDLLVKELYRPVSGFLRGGRNVVTNQA